MKFSFKKYFCIFFSLASFVIYADDAKDSSNRTAIDNYVRFAELKIQELLGLQQKLGLSVNDVFNSGKHVITNKCRNVKNRCNKMIDTVNCSDCKTQNGPILGGLFGLAHVGILKGMKTCPKVQTVATFSLPIIMVSYFVASRNQYVHELESRCKQLEDELSQTLNRSKKSK
jgi:hypothetical protein